MPKIKTCYRDYRRQPSIDLSENAFKITLPNVNCEAESGETEAILSVGEYRIFEYISSHDRVSRAEIEAALGLSQSVTIRTLKKLLEIGMVRKDGNGKNVRYSVKELRR